MIFYHRDTLGILAKHHLARLRQVWASWAAVVLTRAARAAFGKSSEQVRGPLRGAIINLSAITPFVLFVGMNAHRPVELPITMLFEKGCPDEDVSDLDALYHIFSVGFAGADGAQDAIVVTNGA